MNEILQVFKENPKRALNYKQVSSRLNIKDSATKRIVNQLMSDLVRQERLREKSPGSFLLVRQFVELEGTVDMTRSGAAYIVTEAIVEDIYVPQRYVGQALHGDRVKVSLFTNSKKGSQGEITGIVERARTSFAGTFETSGKFAFVLPDFQKIHVDFFIPKNNINGAKDGEKVIVELVEWPAKSANPVGRITEVLGAPGENEVEIRSILADFGFPAEFPEAVEREAAAIPEEITEEEIARRRDFRDITTFTIDPWDAKDFDDALSYRKLENGNIELGVHIADVTHYVRPGTQLEQEALKRGTSVYLVDRVIPMLPETLSNELCSLRPQEEKLCFSAVFELDETGEVKNYWIGKTVIYSDRRFTYEEVQEILENGKGELHEELNSLNEMAKARRKRRMDKGAIAFDKMEVRFKLDEKGMPAEVVFKIQQDAHKLIEEFMLLANLTVAESIGKKGRKSNPARTFVYRVHDEPDPVKLADFSTFVKKFGYKLNVSGGPTQIAQNMNALLKEVKGSREANTIELMAIRSMAKAHYTINNIGHYGLGFPYYSHFTSPIRRYPDMMAHRLLEHYDNGGHSADEQTTEKTCLHASNMERKAAEAERESTKYFQVLYMKDSVGQEFEGVVNGMTEWGMFVEILENKCEGMIRLKEIEDDFYYFDDKSFSISGYNHGRVITLGDHITIRVKNVDLVNKRLDFALVPEEEEED